MHALRGTRRLLAGLALAAFTLGFVPGSAAAKPWPNTRPDGYKLFAKSFGNFGVNRVGLGSRPAVKSVTTRPVPARLAAVTGHAARPTSMSTTRACRSPASSRATRARATPGAATPPVPSSSIRRGIPGTVPKSPRSIKSTDPADVANWPAAAYVPLGDASEDLFDPAPPRRRDRLAGRRLVHHLGRRSGLPRRPAAPDGHARPSIRVMGWNFPSGNEDIVYLILTFYNITSTNAADYAQHRPAMRDCCCQQAQIPGAQQRQVRHHAADRRLHHRPHVRRLRGRHGRRRPEPTSSRSTCRSRWATRTRATSCHRAGLEL